MVTYCHLQPPLTSEIPFNIFDLTRSSQETDSLSPNTHLRLVLAAIPTFNCLPQGNQTILPLNSFKKVVKEDWGGVGGGLKQGLTVPNWQHQCAGFAWLAWCRQHRESLSRERLNPGPSGSLMGGSFILDSLTGFISAKQKSPSLALERYLGTSFPKREDLYLISTSKIDQLL